jgi:serine/threonine-protein kinase
MSSSATSDTAKRDGPVKPGDTVAGKYRIERVLGSSGMGIVYLGTHVDIEQLVAIKFLLDAHRDPNALPRFKREARALARVNSDHVVRVLDVGEHEGAPFIVMEYLAGDDLLRTLRKGGLLPIDRTCDILLQVCEGLAAAHSVGCVHRDLKPSNVFLVEKPDGSTIAKIIDFGVAKLRDTHLDPESSSSVDQLTHTNTLIGSPRYMSPEQAGASRDVDQRADVWSLGIILHEMLTGKPAFKFENISQLLVAIMTEAPRPVLEINPKAPPALAQAVASALVKKPEERTANVLDFGQQLASFTPTGLAHLERIARLLSAPPPSLTSSPSISGPFPALRGGAITLDSPSQTATGWDAPPKKKSRSRAWLALGGAIALVAVAGVAFVASSRYRAAAPIAIATTATSTAPPTVTNTSATTTTTTATQPASEAVAIEALPTVPTNSVRAHPGSPISVAPQIHHGPSGKAQPTATASATATAAVPTPTATATSTAMFDDPR